MTTAEEDAAAPSFHFKRRKTTHTKRARIDDDDDAHAALDTQPLDAPTQAAAPGATQNEEEAVPDLKTIIRTRKRPRESLKHVPPKPEPPQTELVQAEAPRPGQYTSRFVAQTGQVVDTGDKQMTVYVEARMAEQNYRKYGWPIAHHLQSTVAAIAPDLRHTFTSPAIQTAAVSSAVNKDTEHNSRLAAGQGKLQEVDLGPDATARSHKDWAQLEGKAPAPKVRLGRDGKPRRGPKRRNSSDIQRDAMVEAVMREAKLEYFDETPVNPRFAGTDEDMVERFRTEYFEAAEERAARKPTVPVAKDAPKGPKLGGSRSARAAMRLQEEAAAKNKK